MNVSCETAQKNAAFLFEPLVGVREVADALGLHTDTVKKKAQRGEIPALKIGKHWRFRLSEVDGWIKRQLRSTPPQPCCVN